MGGIGGGMEGPVNSVIPRARKVASLTLTMRLLLAMERTVYCHSWSVDNA